MASSEIEVTESSGAANTQNPPSEAAAVDVFSASAYGDLEKLREFVEQGGASLSSPDANGYYALQWAALNNFADVVQYIIENGGNVNATDNVKQTALHWAAVRGSVAVGNVLLQNGAWVEAADINGYRAVHVAAQYGQTSFLNHIVARYHADYDAPDNDGRSPLHWAAYKGYADTIRLLLFRDASQGRQDKEGVFADEPERTIPLVVVVDGLRCMMNYCLDNGCTPLHWAASRGNVEACAVLVLAGTKEELKVKDNAGVTPAQLASNRGHRAVAYFLSNAERTVSDHWTDKIRSGKIGDTGYAPILLCIIISCTILFINSVLAAPDLPKVTASVGLWAWTAISLAVGSLIMFFRCWSKDPGYIKTPRELGNQDAEDPLLSIDVNNSSLWTGKWSQLCPTCKIVRPVRSKHCPSCKHCVEQFDHHCPWISNCVGKKNKWDFFVLICMATLTSFLGAAIAVQRIWTATAAFSMGKSWIRYVMVQHPGIAVFLFIDVIVLISVTILTTAQASQIARNITTNELANAIRYGYLRGPDGHFHNPYNHGCRKNCADFLIHGYTDDNEIAWPSLPQVHR